MAERVELARCRGCGRPIVWGRMGRPPNDKPHPLDPDLVTIVDEDGVVRRGRVSHFATCPEAEAFRASRDRTLVERARAGFNILNANGLPVGKASTWGEAIVERERLERVTRQRLRICWTDTNEPVTRRQASDLAAELGPEHQEGQVALDLDEEPDPRPNSPEDVGFGPR